MSDLISPVVGTQPTVPGLEDFGYTPFRDAQPFSQRTASGYQESLEQVVRHLYRLNRYLTESNPQGQWDANVTALIDAVNDALVAQSEDNAAKVQVALTAISEAQIQVTDPAFLAVLNAATSASRVWLDAQYANKSDVTALTEVVDRAVLLDAPDPSGDTTGATDQAALAPLLAAAQATNGKLRLRSGQFYVQGLSTGGTFAQPIIEGVGEKYTSIIGVGGANAAAIRYKGGSGQDNGGGIRDLQLSNPGGIALQLADVTHTKHARVRITTSAEAVQFLSESTNAFCEFNVCTDFDIESSADLPVHYKKTAGNESFHGSGIDGSSVINQGSGSTNPFVLIDAGCVPYQAPMNFVGFPRSASQAVIANNNGATSQRQPLFTGHVKLESSVANLIFASSTGADLNWIGEVEAFGSTGFSKGAIQFSEGSYYSNGGAFVLPRKRRFSASKIGNAPSIVCPLLTGAGHLIDVYMTASGYMVRYLLWVTQNPTTSSGNIVVLGTQTIDNTAGYGTAVWSISGYVLYASIAGAPANTDSPVGVTAVRTITGVHSGFPDIF